MENYFLTTLALVWVIYIYLFTEADRQISELFNRVKFSLSTNDKDAFNSKQWEGISGFGIPELVAFGKIQNKGSRKKNVERFNIKHQEIEKGKIFLMVNLFSLSFNVIFLNCFITIHIFLTLIFSFIFYCYISRLPNTKFIRFVPMKAKSGK